MLSLWVKGAIMVGALGACIVAKVYFHMKDDNFVEQLAEEVIKDESGIDIDLSPEIKDKI